MEKIKALDQPTTSLNVIRCSTFSPGFLNRQFIIALSDLGVPEDYFLQKMNDSVENLHIEKLNFMPVSAKKYIPKRKLDLENAMEESKNSSSK